jgi:hypothetical protein
MYNRENAGATAIAFARKLTGYPYVYGGTWPGSGGTDCDGLWNWAYAQMGITVYRPTYTGYLMNAWDQRNGHAADPSEPGDLLWIPGLDAEGSAPGHVMGFVEDGQVFQAMETGTLIGQYAYDTSVWSFRTRPALQLALPPSLPLVPKSIADVFGKQYRPQGPIPLLEPNVHPDPAWQKYACQLARLIGEYPPYLSLTIGQWGPRRQNMTIRCKRHFGIKPENAAWGAQLWHAFGVQ